jgi:transposase
VSERKPYKTDVSDEQWALVEPVIAAWKSAHPSVSSHQGLYAMREIANALLYQGRTGCQWQVIENRDRVVTFRSVGCGWSEGR